MLDKTVIQDSLINAFFMWSHYLYGVFALLLLVTVLRSRWFKGLFGEWLVNLIIKLNFKQPDYYLFKDVLLPIDKGTTQIDHVLVSRFGIFVIETKNMKGWIFGKENQAKWLQQIYKHKSYFQNPVHQNFKHKRALETVLDVAPASVKSIVVFVGDAKLKTQMPSNVVYSFGLKKYIRSFSSQCFTETEMTDLIEALSAEKLASNFKSRRDHVKYVKSLKPNHKKNDTIQKVNIDRKDTPTFTGITRLCPKCGNDLVLRTANRGSNKGNEFYGCSAFPKCRYIKH